MRVQARPPIANACLTEKLGADLCLYARYQAIRQCFNTQVPSVYTGDDWVTVLGDKLFHLLLREALFPQVLLLSLKLVPLHNEDTLGRLSAWAQLSPASEAELRLCKGL